HRSGPLSVIPERLRCRARAEVVLAGDLGAGAHGVAEEVAGVADFDLFSAGEAGEDAGGGVLVAEPGVFEGVVDIDIALLKGFHRHHRCLRLGTPWWADEVARAE